MIETAGEPRQLLWEPGAEGQCVVLWVHYPGAAEQNMVLNSPAPIVSYTALQAENGMAIHVHQASDGIRQTPD